ncbi:MAG: TRAP transporter small permease [Parasporobacterium sp.]|nr:TRAP transporter small permease [Parasporobacterium sp.]
MKKAMKKLFRITDKASEIIAWIAVAMVVVMAVMYVIDVVGRLIFSSQMKGTFEIAQFMLCMIVFIAYPYAQVRRGHIHVGFIMNHVPKKPKTVILAFGFLWGAICCGIVAYALWTQGDFVLKSGKASQVLQIPFYPIYYASSVLMGFFGFTILMDLIKAIMALAGDTDCDQSIAKILS